MTLDDAFAALKSAMKEKGVNPLCGLCGSTDLEFEDGVTAYRTMKEAAPALARAQAAQFETMRFFAAGPKPN
jgi:hypothetical protein